MAEEAPVEEELFTIGQVSRETGLPVSTIRFYEKEFGGYIRAIKTPGGHRRFRSTDVTKLKRIHTLAHEQGRALKEVKETLVSDLDPDSLRRDLDLLLEVFENLVQENVKIHKAIKDLTYRLTLVEEDRKKKRFKLF
jgi:DNA-binding transcriptional MerR regulator